MALTRRALLAGSVVALVMGCGDTGPAFADVERSGESAAPGGAGLGRSIQVSYRLRRPATVSASVQAPDGREWALRPPGPRSGGEPYQIAFDGTVPTTNGLDRVVLPDGTYELRLKATEPDGRRDERVVPLRVEGSTGEVLELTGPTISVRSISPDGDGVDDEARITFALSRSAVVELTASDDRGNRAALVAPGRRDAGEHVVIWDGSTGGRVFGGRRLPDGTYVVTLSARDEAGNVRVRSAPLTIADGGIERLEIVEVSISPESVRIGQQLAVRLVVVNSGETTLRTMGPPPGTTYTTRQSFSTLLDPSGRPYAPLSGAWRVGLGWERGEQQLPVRWGILPDAKGELRPGERAVVESRVTVEGNLGPSPGWRFWVGTIREGVGTGSGPVGDRVIAIVPPA